MSKTVNNLKMAFAGESQANRKYLAFAEKAEREGFVQAAKLFRAAAEAEAIHALAHLRAMKGIGSTQENLKTAIAGETDEFTNMYPQMILDAQEEGETAAERLMKFASNAEKNHAELYQNVLNSLEVPKDEAYYICHACGYIHAGSAPEKCPLCGVSGDKFYTVG